MSAVATDPPLCQYDRGYSSVVSTSLSAVATDPPLCQYDRGYSSVVSTLCQPLRQIQRCVSMTDSLRLSSVVILTQRWMTEATRL